MVQNEILRNLWALLLHTSAQFFQDIYVIHTVYCHFRIRDWNGMLVDHPFMSISRRMLLPLSIYMNDGKAICIRFTTARLFNHR